MNYKGERETPFLEPRHWLSGTQNPWEGGLARPRQAALLQSWPGQWKTAASVGLCDRGCKLPVPEEWRSGPRPHTHHTRERGHPSRTQALVPKQVPSCSGVCTCFLGGIPAPPRRLLARLPLLPAQSVQEPRARVKAKAGWAPAAERGLTAGRAISRAV